MTRSLTTAAAIASGAAAATLGGCSAFVSPPPTKLASQPPLVALFMDKGAGGMFDTRDPDAMDHEDPRKSISAAPSFEEYMKNRGGGGSTAEAPATPAPPAAAAPPAPAAPVAAPPAAAAGGGGGSSPDAATVALKSSQDTTLAKIAASIPDLAFKPELSWDAAAGETVAGRPALLDGRDAPGPANVAWISALSVDSRMTGLTIFNGPLNDVPHLLSRTSIDEAGSTVLYELDFRPRAYGAYELVDDEGNYPGPEKFGRKAFEYSGARNEFFGEYCDDEVKAFFASTEASFEGVVPEDAATNSEFDALTRGPLALAVKMPLTDGNVAAIAAAQEKAADYWLTWALDGDSHGHRPGAPVNSQYVYDAKFRINAYSGLLPMYEAMFGPVDGAKLAAADSGPLDEAYVGGGS